MNKETGEVTITDTEKEPEIEAESVIANASPISEAEQPEDSAAGVQLDPKITEASKDA